MLSGKWSVRVTAQLVPVVDPATESLAFTVSPRLSPLCRALAADGNSLVHLGERGADVVDEGLALFEGEEVAALGLFLEVGDDRVAALSCYRDCLTRAGLVRETRERGAGAAFCVYGASLLES